MKKKLYIQPTSVIDDVMTETLLQGSQPGYDPNSSFDDENTVGSRRRTRTVWEDEDGDNF